MTNKFANNNDKFVHWSTLPPVYFARWMWELAVQRNPEKYSNSHPVYQDHKVILT